MIIPSFQSVQYVDENGYLTTQMQMYNDELNNILRNGLSDNGWTLPTVNQAQLAQIQGFTGADALPDGTIWYVHDTDNSYFQLVVKINGVLNKITTTAYP